MQKKLIVAAIAACLAAPAFADKVTLYGILDAGVESVHSDPSGSAAGSYDQFRVLSGINSGSRIGFRGEEKINGALTAGFVLEHGFRLDTAGFKSPGGGTVSGTSVIYDNDSDRPKFFDRQAKLYFKGGFGEVSVGRLYGLQYYNVSTKTDATGAGHGGLTVANQVSRFDNSVVYYSPEISGLQLGLQISAGRENGEDTSAKKIGRAALASLTYKQGPVFLGAATSHIRVGSGDDIARSHSVGGSVDVAGYGRLFASYNVGETKPSATVSEVDTRTYSVGAHVNVGAAGKVIAQYVNIDDRLASDADIDQYSLAYRYNLSKRTNLYLGYVYTEGQNGATVSTYYGDVTPITVTGAGKNKQSSVALGVRHVF